MSLDEIGKALTAAESQLERDRGAARALALRGLQARESAAVSHSLVEACDEAISLLATYADERQAQVLETIQTIASTGLTQVFDEPMELKLVQVARARRIEMDVKIKTGELETSVMDARGGGLAAVTGFLIRAAVLLFKPDARKFMWLDEVFAQLSEEYVPRMAEFIRDLCERTGLQIVLTTHQPEFADAAHKVYRIEKTGPNSSKFLEVKNG